MSNICLEPHHKFQPSHQLLSLKKSLRDIAIPPRRLLTRRPTYDGATSRDIFSDGALLQKYLPHNSPAADSDEDTDDPYSADHFRMYEFKVRRCTRSRSHDWTDCPFAHPGEKARRRDPRRFHYSGTVCPEYRRGGACSRGDACEFSHGVFECWLHPSRYRTEACKDGKNCKRKICFFAHTKNQLRVPPPNSSSHNAIINNNHKKNPHSNNCCMICHCCTCSPTSTLLGMSQFSPPMSPSSPNNHNYGVMSYKDLLSKLVCSLEGLNFGEASSPVSVSKAQNLPWNVIDGSNGENQQPRFNLSPTRFSNGSKLFRNEAKVVDDVNGAPDLVNGAPDLGWVNELLM